MTYSYVLMHHMSYNKCYIFENQCLKMNKSKTKVMMENDTNICQQHSDRECWRLHLGQRYSTRDKNQDKEIQRWITAGWTAFAKHGDIFKGNIGTCLKRQVYNSWVLPAMTYDIETWPLTTKTKNKLPAAKTKMERSMLNITYQNRKTNIWVREKTKVTDVIEQVRRWKWPGQGTSAGYGITDGQCLSSPGNPTKGKDLDEDRQDVGETN